MQELIILAIRLMSWIQILRRNIIPSVENLNLGDDQTRFPSTRQSVHDSRITCWKWPFLKWYYGDCFGWSRKLLWEMWPRVLLVLKPFIYFIKS